MKQQLIQGLPAYIRTEAVVYNTPACSFQQLVTYTSGRHKAAEEVMTMARDGQGPSTPSPSRGPRRLSAIPRTRPTRSDFPALALGETEPPVASSPAANPEPSQPVWGRQDNLPRFLTGRPEDPRRPRICFLCWTAGHMSYTCPILTDQQKALVNKARGSFLQATRSRGAGQDEKGRATRTYNRQLRIAMVQALCDGIDKSNEEDKQDGSDFPALALGETEPPVASSPAANPEPSQPVWGRQDNLPRFLTGRPEDPRRPRICFLCWTAGHMSYTCPILTDQQKALVNKARGSFLQATRSRGAGQDEKGRATRTYNRQLRIAMVQALCDGIDKSNEEDKQDGDLGPKPGTEPDKSGSGNS
ncbi:hypothetical protein BU14_0057s0031 [Porphyra umbilicalis]|uniref:CCHC-type domain-containing protein n=1 Tax=Porphyra umbilicalis TaxID=2786 RepID=A0A1X6PHA0_PORUM|nr:hypothetical protein BU14_0057s0031 [Porphyra umbilicalis]|eukprot:OSX80210.1 hypothetical protein BU14_0057s0031 [Porphyra umbilicalis]